MEVIKNNASEFIVKHRETTGQLVTLTACLGFILLAPVVLPTLFPSMDDIPAWGKTISTSIFLIVLAVAVYISRCFELYSFDRDRQRFAIERVTPFGTDRQSGDLRQIEQIFLESEDTDYSPKEFVILVLAPDAKRLRLPVRTCSFKPAEQKRFGELLKNFLGIPPGVVQK